MLLSSKQILNLYDVQYHMHRVYLHLSINRSLSETKIVHLSIAIQYFTWHFGLIRLSILKIEGGK